MSILNTLLSGSLTKQDRELLRALKKAGVSKVDVVGRGAVTKDVKQIVMSKNFQDLIEKSEDLITEEE